MLPTGIILEVFEVLILGFSRSVVAGWPTPRSGESLHVNTADRSPHVHLQKPWSASVAAADGRHSRRSRTPISCDLRTKVSSSEVEVVHRLQELLFAGFSDFSYLF